MTRFLTALFWWFAIIFTVSFWVAAFLALSTVWSMAHTARPTAAQPMGWKYPWSCCSGMDCSEISTGKVHETPDGYVVTLTPQDHPMLVQTTTFQIPYNDPKIKESPDGVFHICIHRQNAATANQPVYGGTLICFFAPPKGF